MQIRYTNHYCNKYLQQMNQEALEQLHANAGFYDISIYIETGKEIERRKELEKV